MLISPAAAPGLRPPAWMTLTLLSVTLCGGCVNRVTPPADPRDPVTVYVADFGRHSSLLLPTAPGYYNEYAFGDWDWFALRDTSIYSALRAIFFSGAATLGRQQLALPPGADAITAARAVGADRAIRLNVPADRAQQLLNRLEDLHYRHRGRMTYAVDLHMWFVPYRGHYAGWNNCNHLTRRWLEALNCDVRGAAYTSRFVLDSAADSGDADDAAASGVR